jgi:cytochrome c biogenesis protein CcmG/thiol:disulfide interchange protein DsbE
VKHPFRWIALAVGIAVAAFAVVLAVNVSTDPQSDFNTSRLLGKSAPSFALTDLAGKKVTSADLAGKTVIVNFWNSWCAPCKDELPALQQWYAGHRNDADVVLLGVPRDDTDGAIRTAAREDHMDWAVANDRGAEAATIDYATRGQPETFAISPNGVVIASVIGPMRVRDLDRMAAYGRQAGA